MSITMKVEASVEVSIKCSICDSELEGYKCMDKIMVSPCALCEADKFKGTSISSITLKEALSGSMDVFGWVSLACGTDSNRPALTYVCVKGGKYYGSNGKRLHSAVIPEDSPHFNMPDNTALNARTGDVEETSIKFPNFNAVIPDLDSFAKVDMAVDDFDFQAGVAGEKNIDETCAMYMGNRIFVVTQYLVDASRMLKDIYLPISSGSKAFVMQNDDKTTIAVFMRQD